VYHSSIQRKKQKNAEKIEDKKDSIWQFSIGIYFLLKKFIRLKKFVRLQMN